MLVLLRHLMFSITLICLLGRSSRLIAQENIPGNFRQILESIVSIESYDKEGKRIKTGGGFFISKSGNIITHYNVLSDAYRSQIRTVQGEVCPVTAVIAEDKEGGILRIAIDNPKKDHFPLTLNSSLLQRGERLFIICDSEKNEQRIIEGSVSEIFEIPLFGNIVQIDTKNASPLFGSPVININGEVSGIIASLSKDDTKNNFVLPGKRIVQLSPVMETSLLKKADHQATSFGTLFLEGIYYSIHKEYGKALSLFEGDMQRNRENAAVHFQIGFCKNKLGHHKDAIKVYNRLISFHSEIPEAHFQLGLAYFMLKDYQKAIEPLLDATRINPQLYEAHLMLGTAFTCLGRHREAIDAYKQTINIKPNVPEVHYHLGMTYLQLEDKLLAYEEYKVLKELNKHLASRLYRMIYQ